ncbi:hypothetical protein [Amycolatopsis rubida]|uniref:Uncharacterized protein n=1 Tax=Amycolatopsis rubida TaxID=112413 RepID=A0A1I5PQC4_9PSEU|nr:hypothetical protein [Amycolatopsis rubida]SFP35756.1 hypothetical protein SAMN05421854_10532 [Amycolatopsis rubida]
MSPEWLLYSGRPIASSLVLAHQAEFDRLAALTPAARDTAFVAGDPSYDRMRRSRHLRAQYREALGVAPHQKLVTITSTWWRNSLLGSQPSLFREVVGALDRDRYRVAGLVHPNIWHGHGPWQIRTWLADCQRAGLLLPPPAEGWQAVLLASDLVVGDHGATTAYGACLDIPLLLAAFPESDVAPESVGELLGATAPRLNSREPLDVQIERAVRTYRPGSFDDVAALVTSRPGEAAARLRRLFYEHLRLTEPASGPIVPLIPVSAATGHAAPAAPANFIVCESREDRFHLTRYPADVDIDRSGSAKFSNAALTAREDHPDESLRRRAAIVFSASATGDAALADLLRRHPHATVAASSDGRVATRSGQVIETTFTDPEVAAALVFESVLRGLRLPREATVSRGDEVLLGAFAPSRVFDLGS